VGGGVVVWGGGGGGVGGGGGGADTIRDFARLRSKSCRDVGLYTMELRNEDFLKITHCLKGGASNGR